MGYNPPLILIFSLLSHNKLISSLIHPLLDGTYVIVMSQPIEFQQIEGSVTHNHNKSNP